MKKIILFIIPLILLSCKKTEVQPDTTKYLSFNKVDFASNIRNIKMSEESYSNFQNQKPANVIFKYADGEIITQTFTFDSLDDNYYIYRGKLSYSNGVNKHEKDTRMFNNNGDWYPNDTICFLSKTDSVSAGVYLRFFRVK